MRLPAYRLGLLGFGLLGLGACALTEPPDYTFGVFFTNDSAALDEPAKAIVANAARSAKRHVGYPVNVVGYADRDATPSAAKLSQLRADAVTALLVEDGVDAASIRHRAAGTPPNSQPGVESRRVEIDIGDS